MADDKSPSVFSISLGKADEHHIVWGTFPCQMCSDKTICLARGRVPMFELSLSACSLWGFGHICSTRSSSYCCVRLTLRDVIFQKKFFRRHVEAIWPIIFTLTEHYSVWQKSWFPINILFSLWRKHCLRKMKLTARDDPSCAPVARPFKVCWGFRWGDP